MNKSLYKGNRPTNKRPGKNTQWKATTHQQDPDLGKNFLIEYLTANQIDTKKFKIL